MEFPVGGPNLRITIARQRSSHVATIPSQASSTLSVADLNDVREWGWTPLRLAEELNDFRLRSIADLVADRQRPAAAYGTSFFDHPDTWRILVTGPEQIVGFWNFNSFTSAARAVYLDGQSTMHWPIEEVLRPMKEPGWYDIWINTISVHPQYQSLFSAMLLANSLLQVLIDLAQRGILIREVFAGILTREGRLLNHGLGLDLKHIGGNETAGDIYSGHLPSILRRLIATEGSDENMKTLCALYSAYDEQDLAAR